MEMIKSCGNVFEDLGFPPDAVAVMLARSTLMIELEKALKAKGKKQQELADELGIPRTRISEIMNHKTDRFSIDKLVSLFGKPFGAGRKTC